MFSFIIGDIVDMRENSIVLANNGIGFEIFVSLNTLSNIKDKAQVKVFTHLQVKEDGLSLFGFLSEQERALFYDLTAISGIGGKLAITILGGITPSNLILAVANGDVKTLSSIKGVGKKTAERIVLELKSKLGDSITAEMFDASIGSVISNDSTSEAVTVLTSLGITKQEASRVATQAIKAGITDVEGIISYSLKNLNR